MMKIVCFQLITILFLIGIIVFLFLYLRQGDEEERTGKDIWMIRCRRTIPAAGNKLRQMLLFRGQQDEAVLPEGSFYLGSNIFLDDIVLNTGRRVSIYLNVMPDKVLLTVLKGQVKINGYVYQTDQNRQIVIHDYMEVFVNEARLLFRKRQVN